MAQVRRALADDIEPGGTAIGGTLARTRGTESAGLMVLSSMTDSTRQLVPAITTEFRVLSPIEFIAEYY